MAAPEFSVLLVDNDPYMCEIFELILDYHEIPICIFSEATGALEYLQSNKVSLIIIELYLPEIDGYQLLIRIRASGLAPDSKIIATSADYSDHTAQETQSNGFDGFIPKPFDVGGIVPYLRRIAGDDIDPGYDGILSGLGS